jgi:hypothetical protein
MRRRKGRSWHAVTGDARTDATRREIEMIQILWHYTKGLRMPSILADGVIKPSTLHVLEHQRIVWFSRDHIWERTVFCLDTRDGASMQTLAERYGGLFRIAVEPSTAPYTWKDLKHMARMCACPLA